MRNDINFFMALSFLEMTLRLLEIYELFNASKKCLEVIYKAFKFIAVQQIIFIFMFPMIVHCHSLKTLSKHAFTI